MLVNVERDMHGYIQRPEVEYLAGRRVSKVSPKTKHSMVQLALCFILSELAADRGMVGPEWRFRIDPRRGKKTLLVPDVAFLSNERWATIPEALREEPPFGPDVAIEVRSPGDKPHNLREKIAAYLGAGTLLVLDVQPDQRRIVAHASDGVREYENGETFSHPAVAWLIFPVARAFERLR